MELKLRDHCSDYLVIQFLWNWLICDSTVFKMLIQWSTALILSVLMPLLMIECVIGGNFDDCSLWVCQVRTYPLMLLLNFYVLTLMNLIWQFLVSDFMFLFCCLSVSQDKVGKFYETGQKIKIKMSWFRSEQYENLVKIAVLLSPSCGNMVFPIFAVILVAMLCVWTFV